MRIVQYGAARPGAAAAARCCCCCRRVGCARGRAGASAGRRGAARPGGSCLAPAPGGRPAHWLLSPLRTCGSTHAPSPRTASGLQGRASQGNVCIGGSSGCVHGQARSGGDTAYGGKGHSLRCKALPLHAAAARVWQRHGTVQCQQNKRPSCQPAHTLRTSRVDVRNLGHQRVIGVGVCQQRADRQQHLQAIKRRLVSLC